MGKRDPRDERRGRGKFQILSTLTIILLSVLAVRLFFLQFVKHDYYLQYSKDNQLHRERIVSPRGLIKDRNGVVLVDNIPSFDIIHPWVSEKEIKAAILRLGQYLPLDSTAVFSRFELWKKRNAGLPFPVIADADKFEISFVRENYDLFPKLRVDARSRRRYRNGAYAAHLLGYVGEVNEKFLSEQKDKGYYQGDTIGKTGIEMTNEKYLRGKDGQRVVAVNASGTTLGEVVELLLPPIPGKDVVLTIDAELQQLMEELIAPYGAGAAVVLDVSDGAILSVVSLPHFDPNAFSRGISQSKWDALHNAKDKPLFNRFLQATYPPGSTLKVISAYSIMTNKIVPRDEAIVYCTGGQRFGNRFFRCWKSWGHGYMNLRGGLINSCDTYFYKVAETMDVDELADACRKFGLGAKTGIDLPNEIQGLVPDRAYYNRRFGKRKWTQGLVLNNIIGQGEFLASVLQMGRVAASIANGGFLVTPHVVKDVDREPTRIYPRTQVEGLSVQMLTFIRSAMEGVVEGSQGTAQSSRIPGMRAAGKTGTSQNPHGEDHAWFIGYVPADDPEIALAIVVENAGHGGAIAAPIAREFYMEYFGLNAPDSVVTQLQVQTRPPSKPGIKESSSARHAGAKAAVVMDDDENVQAKEEAAVADSGKVDQ